MGMLLLVAILISGCAEYRYSVLQPVNMGQTIRKQPIRLEYPPLVYQLAERDDRLAIQVNNPTDNPITLVGNRSYIVPPTGETHPLNNAIIAPHSFVGMAFPPAPSYYHVYPSFSWGFGFGGPFGPPFGPPPGPHFGLGFYGDPFFYSPPMDYYAVSYPGYWEWKTGQTRLTLFYQQANTTNAFEHQFVFDRQKVK